MSTTHLPSVDSLVDRIRSRIKSKQSIHKNGILFHHIEKSPYQSPVK